jgi:hypothetical protein
MDRSGDLHRRNPHLDALLTPFTSQGMDAFPMLGILRVNAAAVAAVWINAQMFAALIVPAFSTGRTPRLDNSIAQFADPIQFGRIEAHNVTSTGLKRTPRNPR